MVQPNRLSIDPFPFGDLAVCTAIGPRGDLSLLTLVTQSVISSPISHQQRHSDDILFVKVVGETMHAKSISVIVAIAAALQSPAANAQIVTDTNFFHRLGTDDCRNPVIEINQQSLQVVKSSTRNTTHRLTMPLTMNESVELEIEPFDGKNWGSAKAAPRATVCDACSSTNREHPRVN